MIKKLLLIGSVVAPCPPKKQGGTEWVVYYQAKHLAKKGIKIILVSAKGTRNNFIDQLQADKEKEFHTIVNNIEFVEIGGGTQFGNANDSLEIDLSQVEASRKLRIEIANLAKVQQVLIERQQDYDVILTNTRGSDALVPSIANYLKKVCIPVMHLNIYQELAEIYESFKTPIITLSSAQREEFPGLQYAATIPNPVNTEIYSFNENPQNYALMMGTIGYHKNQKDAIIACQKADMKLVLAGKIRDQEYFEKEIQPFIDNKKVIYHGEIDFRTKLKLYQEAKVFLFPILWEEPFGLVVIEALSCGTPVIAYPHGGPREIIQDGINGFLVKDTDEMATKITQITQIKRSICRENVINRFSENIIGEQYYSLVSKYLI